MTRSYLRATSALGCSMLLLVTAHARAQTMPTEQPSADPATAVAPATPTERPPATQADDGEIIVTAQRRAESLQRVGATVSVVGAAELVSQGVDNAADLTRFVPGFQATQSYNGNPVYVLRGVGFNSPNANSTPPVGLYQDEAAVPYPYMTLGMVFDLERVEVLKGPQGTLYGRNATGGLVNFVSAKPTDVLSGGATLEIGNYETVNVTGFVSGPLNDAVRVRLAFNTQNRNDGWQESVTRDDRLGRLHQNSLRGIVDFGDGGPFSATLTGNFWSRTGDTLAPQSTRYIPGAGGNALARASVIRNPTRNQQADWAPATYQSQADIGIIRPAPMVDSRFWSVAGKLAYDVSETVQIASLTTYQDLRHRDATDLGGFQVVANFQDNSGTITSFAQELRLIGTSDTLNWSIGGYYAKDESKQNAVGYADDNAVIATLRGVSLAVNNGRYSPVDIGNSFGNYESRSTGESEVLSAFANVDYRFSDQFKLTLGGRYTEDKSSQAACTYDYRGTNVPVVNLFYGVIFQQVKNLRPGDCYTLEATGSNFVQGAVNSAQKQTNFAWRANVDFTPSPTTLLYANISRGYKAGGYPLIAASRASQFRPIEQEELTAYEVGTKLGLFDRAVQLNLSGFYYDYRNKQIFGRVQDAIFTTLARIDNIPQSHQYGVEGDVTFRVADGLRLNVAGVYLKSEIDEYTSFNQLGVVQNFEGRPYSYTPEFQGNALLTYETPVSGSASLDASVSVSYQGKSSAAIADLPEFEIDDYVLVGATLGVKSSDDRWSIGVYATNLFDTYYWNGVESATDSVFRFAGMPRQFGLRAGFKY